MVLVMALAGAALSAVSKMPATIAPTSFSRIASSLRSKKCPVKKDLRI